MSTKASCQPDESPCGPIIMSLTCMLSVLGLVDDIHEINPALSDVSDPALFPESGLPTSPNRTFRTTCNIAFGRFASAVRVSPGVRRAFAAVHGVPVGALACSWDNPFFTPRPDPGLRKGRGLALHWDDNYYYGGEKAHTADDICVQVSIPTAQG